MREGHLELNGTHRLIPAARVDGSVLLRLPLAATVLAHLDELDGATDGQRFAEAGYGGAIGRDELLAGVPEAAVVNAAFTHPGPYGARFSDRRRGAWYAGEELTTSIAEVATHKRRFLQEARIRRASEFEYQDFQADFYGVFSQLGLAEDAVYLEAEPVPACYFEGQQLAVRLLQQGKHGMVYPSVRDQPAGVCIACFRPAAVYRPRRGRRYRLTIQAGSLETSTVAVAG